MGIESTLKLFNAQSISLEGTGTRRAMDLTGADLIAALGLAQLKEGFGMAVFLGRNNVGNLDREYAIGELSQYVMANACKSMRKAAGNKLPLCAHLLARVAFNAYSTTAESELPCSGCAGRGLVEVEKLVEVYAGHVGDKTTIPARSKMQTTQERCRKCLGRGTIPARCRCGGRGKVKGRNANPDKTREGTCWKDCHYCGGRGFKKITSPMVYKVIKTLLPDINEKMWLRNFLPMYEELIGKCKTAEKEAEKVFNDITR